MKIYFVSAHSRGLDDFDEEIVRLLSEYGEVLLGDANDLDPGYTYERNTEYIQEAEVIIAEISSPSTSVGYEVGLAESLEKRILCLYRNSDEEVPSPMIIGNRKFSVAEYETIEDVEGVLRDFF